MSPQPFDQARQLLENGTSNDTTLLCVLIRGVPVVARTTTGRPAIVVKTGRAIETAAGGRHRAGRNRRGFPDPLYAPASRRRARLGAKVEFKT